MKKGYGYIYKLYKDGQYVGEYKSEQISEITGIMAKRVPNYARNGNVFNKQWKIAYCAMLKENDDKKYKRKLSDLDKYLLDLKEAGVSYADAQTAETNQLLRKGKVV